MVWYLITIAATGALHTSSPIYWKTRAECESVAFAVQNRPPWTGLHAYCAAGDPPDFRNLPR